jgi:hypothetical protein
MLPDDGPMWPKLLAHKHRIHIHFNDILKHFNEHFSELNVDLTLGVY